MKGEEKKKKKRKYTLFFSKCVISLCGEPVSSLINTLSKYHLKITKMTIKKRINKKEYRL